MYSCCESRSPGRTDVVNNPGGVTASDCAVAKGPAFPVRRNHSVVSDSGRINEGAHQTAVVLAKRGSQGSAIGHGLAGGGVGRADEE